MSVKRIVIASPGEPSGGSWLINCFLELGIKVGHKPFVDNVWRGSHPALPPDHIWQPVGGRHVINPKARSLAKFLPSIGREDSFAFRDDVEIDYVQDLPLRDGDDRPVLLIARDPRDALYSHYRRVAPELTFEQHIRFPNPLTLLDRATHWALFFSAWLDRPDVHVVRFEDYKQDARATLVAALASVDLRFADDRIDTAIENSSFEAARAAEEAFRQQFPKDREIANRAGKVGDGRGRAEVRAALPQIESATASILGRLGYDIETAQEPNMDAVRLNARFLSVFETIHLPEHLRASAEEPLRADQHLLALLVFANRLDAGAIRQSRLVSDDARQLIDSLSEFLRNHHAWLAERLSAARAEFRDGSDYFFEQIRELRRARSAARTGPGTG